MEIIIALIIAGVIAPIAVSDAKKNLAMENKVALIAWIPMQMILLFASLVIMTYLGRILEISGELYGRSLRSGLIYSLGGLTTMLLAMLGVTIVGFFVLYRHEYGSRKYLVHCAVWYAVYLALTVVVFLYETARWNVEWIAPVTACFITVCIYPVMVFFGLKLVVALTRGPLTAEKLTGIAAWIPLQIGALILVVLIEPFIEDILPHKWALDKREYWECFDLMYNVSMMVGLFVAVIGWILILRHDCWSRKFWKHIALWYGGLMVIALGIIFWLSFHWDIWGDHRVTAFAIAICFYPLIALAELALVIAIVKGVRWMIARNREMT